MSMYVPEIKEEVSEHAKVLVVEDDGKVYRTRVPNSGVQADWTQNDETSPAFIMNKPKSFGVGGGYAYYYLSKTNYLYKLISAYEVPLDFDTLYAATREEFENDYYTKPIMLCLPSGYGPVDIVNRTPMIFYGINDSSGSSDPSLVYYDNPHEKYFKSLDPAFRAPSTNTSTESTTTY